MGFSKGQLIYNIGTISLILALSAYVFLLESNVKRINEDVEDMLSTQYEVSMEQGYSKGRILAVVPLGRREVQLEDRRLEGYIKGVFMGLMEKEKEALSEQIGQLQTDFDEKLDRLKS